MSSAKGEPASGRGQASRSSSSASKKSSAPPHRQPTPRSKQYRHIIAAEVALEDSTLALTHTDDTPVRLLAIRPRTSTPPLLTDYGIALSSSGLEEVPTMENGNVDTAESPPPTQGKQPLPEEVVPVPVDFVDEQQTNNIGMEADLQSNSVQKSEVNNSTSSTSAVESSSTLSQEVSREESSVVQQESSVHESSVQESSVQESSSLVRECSTQESSEIRVAESQITESSVQESRVQEASIQESSVQESRVQESSVQESSVQESSVQESSISQSIQESSIQESSITRQESSTQESTVEESSVIQESSSTTQEASRVEESVVQESASIVESSSAIQESSEKRESSSFVQESSTQESSSIQESLVQESSSVQESSTSIQEAAESFINKVIESAQQELTEQEVPPPVNQDEVPPPVNFETYPPANQEDSVPPTELDDSLQKFADDLQEVEAEVDRSVVELEESQMNQVTENGIPPSPGPTTLSETKSEEKSESIETKEEDVEGGHIEEKEFRTQTSSDYAKTEISEDGTTKITKEQEVKSVRVVREVTVTEKEFGKLDEILEGRMRLIPGSPFETEIPKEKEPAESAPVPESAPVLEEPLAEGTIEIGSEERAIDVPSEPIVSAEAPEDDNEHDESREVFEDKAEKSQDEDAKSKDSVDSPKSAAKKEKGGFFSFFKRKSHKSSTSDGEVSPKSPRKEPKSPKKEKKKKEKRFGKKKDKTPEPDMVLQEEKEPEVEEVKEEAPEVVPPAIMIEEEQSIPEKPMEEINYPMETEVLIEKESGEEEVRKIHVIHESSTSTSSKSEATSHDVKVVNVRTSLPPGMDPPEEVQDDMSVQVERKEQYLNSEPPKCFTLPNRSSQVMTTVAAPLSPPPPEPSPSTSQMLAPVNSHDLHSLDSGVDSGTSAPDPSRPAGHFVVVAIDFGTTFSGYAFSFTRDQSSIHMMRKWEGGDPGLINQKTPTCLLLTPDGQFHSFGFTARDFYHDLDPKKAEKWLYFEKFKMVLHHNADLNAETSIEASNGKSISALAVFSHALRFFKEHALQELSDQSSTKILNEDVKWVITVPAIWKAPAKQFMRRAAYNAGIASIEYPDQLLISLEPEAASIYVRKLRMHQLVPEYVEQRTPLQSPNKRASSEQPSPMNLDQAVESLRPDPFDDSLDSTMSSLPPYADLHPHPPSSPYSTLSTNGSIYPLSHSDDTIGTLIDITGMRYMIVDCGGGTVDITVHEMESRTGKLHELYKASGGPYGSVGVDLEFENLLIAIFGAEFIKEFKYKRPAGWVDLMIAFESRKRAASPYKNNPLNVSLPFSFIQLYKDRKRSQVETAIRKFDNKDIRWSSQGMMRLNPEAMRQLFLTTLNNIKESIGDVLNNPAVKDIAYLFLVGGFSESPMLQAMVRSEFGHLLKIIIPQDVSLTILKGAVCFGLDPSIVNVRRSRMTYGVGVLNRFDASKHPKERMVKKDSLEWCTDIFDRFVISDQPVALGDTVLRSYTPAKAGQKSSVINVYCTERNDVMFVTDPGVHKCGTLCLDLSDMQYHQNLPTRREIQTRMIFGDTEIKCTALDVATGKCVRSSIDFMN